MLAITEDVLDQELPRSRLAILLKHFADVGDDREPWRVMYPLKEVLLLLTCATIAACDDFDDICAWGRHQGYRREGSWPDRDPHRYDLRRGRLDRL